MSRPALAGISQASRIAGECDARAGDTTNRSTEFRQLARGLGLFEQPTPLIPPPSCSSDLIGGSHRVVVEVHVTVGFGPQPDASSDGLRQFVLQI